MDEMTEEQFEEKRIKLKKLSNNAFDSVVLRQRGSTPDDFLDMVTKSEYFRDLFFEGYIEGANMYRERGDKI